MQVPGRVETAFLNQRGYLFQWSPVCLAIGIGSYFTVRFEPGLVHYGGLVLLALALVLLRHRVPVALAPLAWGMVLASVGFCLAGARANSVAEPVLQWRYYGPVEGRVVSLDRSASDALRVTLDGVRLGDVPLDRMPARVRLSVHGDSVPLMPGQRIMTTAHLSPPQGPVEPGGFDFRRHAWFQRLGAVGYTRNPVLTVAPAADGSNGTRIAAFRLVISKRVQSALPVETAGFAAAITTGDRSAIEQDTLTSLRTSNLAHLLAISGLHMGLLTGFVFVSVRVGLSLVPPVALRTPVRKIAAVFALMSAAGYLLLSGGSVATERAFVMVSVMFVAVLLDRRAISMRAVAVAALVVLVLRPESLLSPGFQMSFAATTALVATFGALRDVGFRFGTGWVRGIVTVIVSSAVAGMATAPFGAAHFNSISHYGLLANLLSVPVMGSVVIPAAVVAALLAPFGLEWIGLQVMGLGLNWILWVAEWVARFDGSQGFVTSPPVIVLPVLSLGALWFFLWQGRFRWAGVVTIVVSVILWGHQDRPQVLIAENGGLVGVMTGQGRALSKAKGSGFVASVWLENDGDGTDQAQAATRWPDGLSKLPKIVVGDKELVHVTGKRAARMIKDCTKKQILVAAVPVKVAGECLILGPEQLKSTGSIAIQGGQIISSSQMSGNRIWSPVRNPDRQTAKLQ